MEQSGVRPAIEGELLGFAHFRRGDHLHCLGDLGSVFDRFDSASDIAGVGGHLGEVYGEWIGSLTCKSI